MDKNQVFFGSETFSKTLTLHLLIRDTMKRLGSAHLQVATKYVLWERFWFFHGLLALVHNYLFISLHQLRLELRIELRVE